MPAPGEIERINSMDPVDFQESLYKDFQNYVMRRIFLSGTFTPEDRKLWIEDNAYFLDQPGIDETFQYSAEKLEELIQRGMARDHAEVPDMNPGGGPYDLED